MIIVIAGLILSPLKGLVTLGEYKDIHENFQYLTNLQIGFICYEMIFNTLFLILIPPVLLYLAHKRKMSFPYLFNIWAIGNLIFMVSDLLFAYLLFGEYLETAGEELIDKETRVELFRGFVQAAIWIPYMNMSRRVRNTFVN